MKNSPVSFSGRGFADPQASRRLFHVDDRAGPQAPRPHLLAEIFIDLLLQRLDVEDGTLVHHRKPS